MLLPSCFLSRPCPLSGPMRFQLPDGSRDMMAMVRNYSWFQKQNSEGSGMWMKKREGIKRTTGTTASMKTDTIGMQCGLAPDFGHGFRKGNGQRAVIRKKMQRQLL